MGKMVKIRDGDYSLAMNLFGTFLGVSPVDFLKYL